MNNSNNNQEIKLIDRKTLYVSGVIKINNFDDEEFLLDTNMGSLLIKGNDMEIVKLDTHDGTLIINGIISSIDYIEETSKKGVGFFEKIFK